MNLTGAAFWRAVATPLAAVSLAACGSTADGTTPAAALPSTATRTAAESSSAVTHEVSRVVDGDTLHVPDGPVRLAQVDAPETGDCYGSESTLALQNLVEGNVVTLRRPTDGPDREKYGRLLREVGVGATSVNVELVRIGAAEWYEEFAKEDSELAERMADAEASAKAARAGLWATCPAENSTVAPTAAVPSTTTAPERRAPTIAQPVAQATCHGSYTGTCIPPDAEDADCAGGSGNGPFYVQEKNIRVTGADVFDLDRDGDGIGCEA